MILPLPASLSWLLGFLFAACAVLMLLGALPIALLASPRWGLAIGILISLLAVVGVLKPETLNAPYRAWNALAKGYAALAREWTLRACFLALLAVSLARPRAAFFRHPALPSLWERRRTAGVETCGRGAAGTIGGSRAIDYWRWARRTGNGWAACLLPFVLLLALLDEEERSALPDKLYTLY